MAVAVGNWVNIQDGAAQLSAIFSGGFAIFSSHLLDTRYVMFSSIKVALVCVCFVLHSLYNNNESVCAVFSLNLHIFLLILCPGCLSSSVSSSCGDDDERRKWRNDDDGGETRQTVLIFVLHNSRMTMMMVILNRTFVQFR